jgi:hypothetical protein
MQTKVQVIKLDCSLVIRMSFAILVGAQAASLDRYDDAVACSYRDWKKAVASGQ